MDNSSKPQRQRKPYKPEALIYLLREVERELRDHGREAAANIVNLSVSAVSEDVAYSVGSSRYLM